MSKVCLSRISRVLLEPAKRALIINPVNDFHTSDLQLRKTKHWAPKFKKLRREKFIKIDLPNLNEKIEDLSPDERTSRMKERGVLPPRPWMERPFVLTSTAEIFEAYVPPEGDGIKSIIGKEGAKQKVVAIEKKTRSMMAIRKIKSYDDDFTTETFLENALEIYKKAHEHLAKKEKLLLRQYVTERAYPEMMHNTQNKQMVWKYLQLLEPARIVHGRVTNLIEKENLFAQLTVRIHSQQCLAIYDRFGRLMYGHEFLPKDVLEYIVFEKHLADEYGTWRIHGKITPSWMPPRSVSARTHVIKTREEATA